jgi:hypothetical protein
VETLLENYKKLLLFCLCHLGQLWSRILNLVDQYFHLVFVETRDEFNGTSCSINIRWKSCWTDSIGKEGP